ncbi:hypothetical protein JCM9279_002105 [Rhodotorula babjevae]
MDSKIFISSSSSPDSSSPPPLLRLSNELLDVIFSLAYRVEPSSWATGRPICRRLLPFQRAHLWRHAEIRSYEALKSFQCVVMRSSSTAKLVRHLDIAMASSDNVDRGSGAARRRSGPDDEGNRRLVTPIDFAALVPRLVRLESLETNDFDESLLVVVFLNQSASSRLASLERLEFSNRYDPLVEDGCDIYADDPILPTMHVPPTFPRLARLVMEQGSCFVWNRALARCTNLEQLFLCRGAFDTTLPSALTDLIALDKLVHLSFRNHGIIPDAFLLALLNNPSHLPNLKTLELNHVTSSLGDTVEVKRGAIPPYEERRSYPHWPMWKGWVAPMYPRGVTEEGLLAVSRAARARGIVLKGKICSTLRWRTAFEAERRAALLALGDLTGEYRRAREALGAEAVNAHILARSLEIVDGGESGGEGGEGGEA